MIDETTVKTCPRCKHTGPVLTDFGLRLDRREPRSQPWCLTCRIKTKRMYIRNGIIEKYVAAYPNDKAGRHRSVKFMLTKLKRRRLAQ